MDLKSVPAVVGTNSWGGSLYGRVLRGDYVDEDGIRAAVDEALKDGLRVFDTARDYGFGKGQPLLGRAARDGLMISAKYTPMGKYRAGQVRASFEKDLKDFGRSCVDVYWLHLPNSIEENLAEMIALYREGKIQNIGVSNFNLEECGRAKAALEREGIQLFGVQNHYSLLDRTWERNGLTKWCAENGVSFWAWAVLEEGMLTGKEKKKHGGIMRAIYRRQRERLLPLFDVMTEVGGRYGLTNAQTAMAFVASKGLVPICGCRRASQVRALAEAASVRFTNEEIARLEAAADAVNVKVLGADMFRFAVRREGGRKR